ncbi:hypothetical protein MasN3_23130 [Massilia varians]|uniref:Band 7 domain-containing protein n=1 Tax=Massilia varians TaxID=457921 RepID=A0ABM8C6E8_9BURK|nr:hypothetical protein [Massilia varians]BDT58819.1 hypothetical protein MasN3_23130 [Massilia varians]
MVQMFGVKGAACPRCERKQGGDARYCAGCGLILGAPRNSPVLRENRWVAGPDELAVFFGVRELSGLFVKTLRVPATARAYILQGMHATEVPQGEYEIEGFFTRLNHLLRDQHAEILVTRTGALPVEFCFDDVATCEQLAVSARFTISLRIENVAAFARHFMTLPGTIGSTQLRELLAPAVRQLAEEFVGARSIREMAGKRELRDQLDERLQGGLKLLLLEYGLAAVKVDTIELRHDKYDAHRARVGSLWLAADERHVQIEHAKHLDELYDAEEWQRLRRAEQAARVRQRERELRQDDAIARAELSLQGADRAHAVRARQIELYARILDAGSRKQALERGAGEVLAELEHELAKKGARRLDEAQEWQHLRAMAQVRMRGELEVAQQDARQTLAIARQRFSQQLLQQQIRYKIEQAALIEDAARRQAELVRLRASQEDAARRGRAIDEEEHVARHQALVLANAARRREAERLQEWEDEQARQRIESTRAGQQQDKLARTIELDARQARAAQDVQLEGEERRHALELRRLEAFAAMDDTAKLALAAAPNAALLNDFMKTRVQADMDAGQLAALAELAGAGKLSTQEALQLVRDEQARRELEVERDRRHQVALLAAAAAPGRQCAHGHPAREGERFCAACGAALPH